jgi:hypothetical protein
MAVKYIKHFGSGIVMTLVNKVTQPAAVSGQAVLGGCAFAGLIVRPDGTNEVTLNVFDNTEALGNRILPSDIKVKGNAGLWAIGFDPGVDVEVGVYVELAVAGGGSAEYQVLYDESAI